MEKPKNRQWRAVKGWFITAAVGLGMVFAPWLFDIDIMEGGGALIMLGLLVAPTALIVAVLYIKRARILDRMFAEDNILAHWEYDRATWERYRAEDAAFRKGHAQSVLAIIAFFCVLIGAAFWIFDPEAGFIVFCVLMGVLSVCALAAFLSVWIPKRRNRKPGAVFISLDGLWVNGELHTWSIFGARLEEIYLVEGEPLQLECTYSFPSRTGTQSWTVRVAVPSGEQKHAEEIVVRLREHAAGQGG